MEQKFGSKNDLVKTLKRYILRRKYSMSSTGRTRTCLGGCTFSFGCSWVGTCSWRWSTWYLLASRATRGSSSDSSSSFRFNLYSSSSGSASSFKPDTAIQSECASAAWRMNLNTLHWTSGTTTISTWSWTTRTQGPLASVSSKSRLTRKVFTPSWTSSCFGKSS